MKNAKNSLHWMWLVILSSLNWNLSAQSEILGHTYIGTLGNGHYYYLSNCPTNWYEAAYAADQMGGYLLTLNSQHEHWVISEGISTFEIVPCVYDFIDTGSEYLFSGGVWLGMISSENADGICEIDQWLNGEDITFTAWSGQTYPEPNFNYCGKALAIGGNGQSFYPEYEDCNSDQVWRLSDPLALRWYIVEFESDPGCDANNKSYVCHNGNTICVNNDAVQAHLNHGDYLGPCGPCNQNLQIPRVDVSPRHLGEIDHSYAPGEDQPNPEDTGIQIFPNPVESSLHVMLPAFNPEAFITITTMSGTSMYEAKLNTTTNVLDMSSLSAGCYIAIVESNFGIFQQRIIKQY